MLPLPSQNLPVVDSPVSPAKPRRQQVSRACEGCRVRRIKCDDSRPCQHCRLRGDNCMVRGNSEPRTLAQALREVDRLKQRVMQLERELEVCRNSSTSTRATSTSTGLSTAITTPETSSIHPLSPPTEQYSTWEGIFMAVASSDQTSFYGPSSGIYFISRIGAYLAKTMHEPPLPPKELQPRGISRSLVTPTDGHRDGGGKQSNERLQTDASGTDRIASTSMATATHTPILSRALEEHFIALFWDYYYYCIPILEEDAFRQHYFSLWEGQTVHRKHSALVDMVLALALQYGYTFLPKAASDDNSDRQDKQPDRDATIAGRWYYQRAKSLLTRDLESPSLSTLQCLLFSITYLCCASFQNTAHVVIAQAIRTAQILGLHQEPSTSLPLAERELRKRLWWVLYTVEAKTTMKLGRPFLMDTCDATVTLPSDDVRVADLGSSVSRGVFGSDGSNTTWLSFSLQCHKLLTAGFQIHRVVWQRYGHIMAATGQTGSPYQNPATLERCAEFLATQFEPLQSWVAQVPEGLKLQRLRGGISTSLTVDCESLMVGGNSADMMLTGSAATPPTWLQRQRVCLELLYHNVAVGMYRPFISFCPKRSGIAQSYTPTAESHATACAHHAAAMVDIMHQTVTRSSILRGWHEYFLWHWNATVTLIGFLLANPVHVLSAHVRIAIDKGIAVCDIFGVDFSVAASAATIARCLTKRADSLISHIRGQVLSLTIEPQVAVSEGDGVNVAGRGDLPTIWELDNASADLSWLDPSTEEAPENFEEFMDWALAVEAFNNFEHFSETTNSTDLFQ